MYRLCRFWGDAKIIMRPVKELKGSWPISANGKADVRRKTTRPIALTIISIVHKETLSIKRRGLAFGAKALHFNSKIEREEVEGWN
jgi:hypothetical protein